MLEFLDLFSTYQKFSLYTVNFFAFFSPAHFPWNISIFVTGSNNSFMTEDVNHLQINTVFYCHHFIYGVLYLGCVLKYNHVVFKKTSLPFYSTLWDKILRQFSSTVIRISILLFILTIFLHF